MNRPGNEGKRRGERRRRRGYWEVTASPSPYLFPNRLLRAILDCFSEANNSFLESPASRCMYFEAFPHQNRTAMHSVLSGENQQVRRVQECLPPGWPHIAVLAIHVPTGAVLGASRCPPQTRAISLLLPCSLLSGHFPKLL